jgi:hypothetical protein
MTCEPGSPGTPRPPWSPGSPACGPAPAIPPATPSASPCASWDGARSSSTASSSASTSSSFPSSPPAPRAFWPCTGSAPHRGAAAHRGGRPPWTAPVRGRLGAPARRRPDPRLFGESHPPPAQPRRRPAGQPCPVAGRVHPDGLGRGHPRLRRAPHGRREIQGGDYPLPEALRRPRGLPPPPPGHPLTPNPRGRPDPLFGCREPAGLLTIRRPSPASFLTCWRDLIRACVPSRAPIPNDLSATQQ